MAKKKHNKHKSPKDASLGDTSEEEINNVNIQGKNISNFTFYSLQVSLFFVCTLL